MNFNHLLGDKRKRYKCPKNAGSECYWVPTGNIRSMVGENVNVSLYCRHCGHREEAFLTSEQFKIQEKIISNEVKSV